MLRCHAGLQGRVCGVQEQGFGEESPPDVLRRHSSHVSCGLASLYRPPQWVDFVNVSNVLQPVSAAWFLALAFVPL